MLVDAGNTMSEYVTLVVESYNDIEIFPSCVMGTQELKRSNLKLKTALLSKTALIKRTNYLEASLLKLLLLTLET